MREVVGSSPTATTIYIVEQIFLSSFLVDSLLNCEARKLGESAGFELDSQNQSDRMSSLVKPEMEFLFRPFWIEIGSEQSVPNR